MGKIPYILKRDLVVDKYQEFRVFIHIRVFI